MHAVYSTLNERVISGMQVSNYRSDPHAKPEIRIHSTDQLASFDIGHHSHAGLIGMKDDISK